MIKNNIIKTIYCLLFLALAFCSSSWAADTKRTTKKDQLPSPVVTLPEIHDSDYLQGRRFEDRFLNLGVKKKFTILERNLI